MGRSIKRPFRVSSEQYPYIGWTNDERNEFFIIPKEFQEQYLWCYQPVDKLPFQEYGHFNEFLLNIGFILTYKCPNDTIHQFFSPHFNQRSFAQSNLHLLQAPQPLNFSPITFAQ